MMETVAHAGIEVERCPDCGGLWLDMGEREQLKTAPGAEALDTGDTTIGQRMNMMGRIRCPVCGAHMIRMVDNQQPHIWYESCPACYGVFFDAGEFKDYVEENIFDFFKGWKAKERK
jgi:Zn-finger nucleic acid-binding protein